MYYLEHEFTLHWQNLDDRANKWQKLDGDNADHPHLHMPLLIQPPNENEQYPVYNKCFLLTEVWLAAVLLQLLNREL